MQRLNAAGIKKNNEKIVLNALRRNRSVTIRQLSAECLLSFPTVSKILDEMGERVIVSEAQESTGGRSASIYKLNAEYEYRLLVYYYPNIVKYEVRDSLGDIVEKRKYTFVGDVGDELIRLAQALKQEYPKLNVAAVGLPGVVHNGVAVNVMCAKELNGRDLEREIAQKADLVCVVENDMNVITLEATAAYHAEDSSLVCLYFNDVGPGCGISVEGQILRGAGGYAGEIGFVPIEDKVVLRDSIDGYNKYCVRLIASIAAFINPEKVVFFANGLQPAVDGLTEKLADYIPAEMAPEIILSYEHEQYYFNGLLKAAIAAADGQ